MLKRLVLQGSQITDEVEEPCTRVRGGGQWGLKCKKEKKADIFVPLLEGVGTNGV